MPKIVAIDKIAKNYKIIVNGTNDNLTPSNGWLDLFYTTYYQVVVLCAVKDAFLCSDLMLWISKILYVYKQLEMYILV
jgi:hypothetical protein